jgi:SAM-dependent methyltransferase
MDECPLYSDPRFYDLLFPNAGAGTGSLDPARSQRILASERFYVEAAQHGGGSVLELACGSGRLTIPIAQKGIEVVGLDFSRSMLDAAQAKAAAAGAQVKFVQGDMRSFEFPQQFATILMAGNSLLHLLTAEDLKQCLAGVRRHLAAGGHFIFDVFNPDMRQLARDPQQRHSLFTVNHPERGEIIVEETAGYDAASQVRTIRWYVSSPGAPDFQAMEYQLRVIFPQELLLLLQAVGFRLEKRYGEFTGEPFASSSPRQICICSDWQV